MTLESVKVMTMQSIQAPAQPTPSREKITFEEYLRRYDSYEGGRTEWLAGEVDIHAMTNNAQHNELLRFLMTFLSAFVELNRSGRVVLAGVPMYYSDDAPAREPDLMILLTPHENRLTHRYVQGVADIVVEIVSPESDERDRGTKFLEYEAAGVPEYWMFDPLRQIATIYARGHDGRYRPLDRDAQGRLVSTLLPGFALDTDLLWQDALPGSATIVTLVQNLLAE